MENWTSSKNLGSCQIWGMVEKALLNLRDCEKGVGM
jgi:hypothetical protein